jgi:hypothetical protein
LKLRTAELQPNRSKLRREHIAARFSGGVLLPAAVVISKNCGVLLVETALTGAGASYYTLRAPDSFRRNPLSYCGGRNIGVAR